MAGKKRQAGNRRPKKNNIVAIALLVLAAVVLLYIMTVGKKADSSGNIPYPGLDQSSEIILKTLVAPQQGAAGRIAVVIGDKVDSNKLKELANTPYEELKSEIGVKNDFAIYFVNGDDTIIPIGGKPCIGSPKAEVDGKRCG